MLRKQFVIFPAAFEQWGRNSVRDNPKSGRFLEARTKETIKKVENFNNFNCY